MRIVIFGQGTGAPRQLNLSGRSIAGLGCVFALLAGVVGFGVGHLWSSAHGSGVSVAQLESYNEEIRSQQENIATIRRENEDTLDALSIRLAQINARIIRLDALGRRLTDMADLDDGEFDFDSEPAVGGPDEPADERMVTGEVAEVPEVVEAMQLLDRELDNREAQLGALETVLANRKLSDRVYPQGRPVNAGWISSYFGKRTDPFTGKPANHTGIDFAGKYGADVVAVADGVVTWSGDRYGYGIMVEINHGNGYATRYAHNSENLVDVGDEVRKGEIVAYMGETGRATGPNLHFEVLKNGRRVNPVNFIRESSR